jgi:hypothetical protein
MLWVGAGFLIIVAGYLVYAVVSAKCEVDDAPRVDMFNCPKHGLIPAKYTLKLDVMTETPIEFCPMCFEDKMKAAKAGK